MLQFGHLFAKGDTREGAIRAMVVALKEVKIRGEIRTTVDYCVEMIQSPDFVGNNIHTGWLDARISSHVSVLDSYIAPAQLCNIARGNSKVHAGWLDARISPHMSLGSRFAFASASGTDPVHISCLVGLDKGSRLPLRCAAWQDAG